MSKKIATKPRIISLSVAVVGVALVVIVSIIGWVVVPNVIEKRVKEEQRLVDSSETYDKWVELPVPILFKVWFFNVSNAHIFYGNDTEKLDWSQTPIFKEVGPYVFEERHLKYDFHDGPNDSIFFKQNVTYNFNAELSGEGLSQEDVLTLVNIPMITVATLLDVNPGMHALGEVTMQSVLNAPDNGGSLFAKFRVADVLFRGVKLPSIYRTVETIARLDHIPLPEEILNGNFAFFRGRNATNDGEWSVYKGDKDSEKFNIIRSIGPDGRTSLDGWWDAECADINGTDGTMFPPFLEKDQRLYIFQSELSRSIHITYDSEIEYEGIKGYRYIIPKSLFEKPSVNPENHCFCMPVPEPLENKACDKSGFGRLFSAKAAVPIIISKPHFFGAESSVIDEVLKYGLSPSAEAHDSYLDLEPRTGFPLRAHVRLQIGAEIQKLYAVNLTPFNTIPHRQYPVLWLDKHAELNEELVEEIKDKLVRPLNAVNIAKWVLIGVGAFMALAGVAYFAYNWSRG